MHKKLLDTLQRRTSSQAFIPEIDGLRFVAISAVVLYHIAYFLSKKDTHIYTESVVIQQFVFDVFKHGHLGVELFFCISGIVLSLPFAAYYLNNTVQPDLKRYYFRRLKRLEPPYFVVLFLLFFVHCYLKKYDFEVLIQSLLASVFYVHNFVFPETRPLINPVTWSLEIEIQFYILAPFLARVFVFERAIRRSILVIVILFSTILNALYLSRFESLLSYIHYFAIGFLLTDFMLLPPKTQKIPSFVIVLLGILAFSSIWYFDPKYVPEHIPLLKVLYCLLLVCAIFLFSFLVLFTPFWKRIFSIQVLTVIGGMCYSIYLLHYTVISLVGNPLLGCTFSGSFLVSFFGYVVVLVLAVLVVGGGFYRWVEQRFMG